MAQVTNEAEDDDDFGDFSAAEKPLSNGQHHGEKPTEDDDFGNFASSTPENNPLEGGDSKSAEQATPTDDDDDFGDFGSAPTSMSNLAVEEVNAVPKNGADSAKAPEGPAQLSSDAPKPNTSPESSSVGDYETAAEEEEGDEFGDFGGAAAAPVPAPVPTPVPAPSPAPGPSLNETAETNEDDEFGDFGTFNDAPNNKEADPIDNQPSEDSAPESELAPTTEEAATTGESPQGDDDFGDFDTAPSNPSAGAQSASGPPPENNVADDFGDFGSAPQAETNAPPAKSEGEDDFGDFGSAPATENNALPPKSDDDDDFGDFGDFDDSAPPAAKGITPPSESDAPPPKSEGEDDFGDFGDFDSAPSSEPNRPPPKSDATTPQGEGEDDFGDFGDFDSAPAAETSPPPPKIDDGDDDFGDFGDFDSAPAVEAKPPNETQSRAQPHDSNAGFGTNFDTKAQARQSTEASDPVLQKAKTVFSKVFENFKLEDSDQGASDSSETIAVAGLTASIDGTYDGTSNDKLVKGFQAILEEMQKEVSPPLFIVAEGEGYSPNAHFSVPIDGESFGPGSRARKLDNFISQQHTQPSQPQIQSTAAEHANARPTQATSTMVQLPPQSSTAAAKKEETGGEQESDKAQSLLQQIPDLAFMLQSKLWLPSNVK